jgi:hypothetical protein
MRTGTLDLDECNGHSMTVYEEEIEEFSHYDNAPVIMVEWSSMLENAWPSTVRLPTLSTQERVRTMIADGWTIVWTGIGPNRDVYVRLHKEDEMDQCHTIPVSHILQLSEHLSNAPVLTKNESTDTERDIGVMWKSSVSWVEDSRRAGILGLNLCASASPGIQVPSPLPKGLCTMAYDLETMVPDPKP